MQRGRRRRQLLSRRRRQLLSWNGGSTDARRCHALVARRRALHARVGGAKEAEQRALRLFRLGALAPLLLVVRRALARLHVLHSIIIVRRAARSRTRTHTHAHTGTYT